ncbi:MAG TPA: EAL domain-containing protein [Burkholderiales bacterium]
MIREPEFKKRETAREPVRILLLEDNPDFAELLRTRLRAMRSVSSHVEVVDRLSQALVKLASDNFGLIIADLNVVDSTGVETVRALAPAASQPIMVLTADQDPALREACLEAGAYDFLTKDQVSAAALERLVRLATIQSDIQRALRESEARIARLLDLSSEWYWEQDAQFRLSYMSSIRKTGLDMSPYLGRRRWDQPALNLSAADWARHRAQLERHEPFRDFELERPSPDGSVWVSLSGDPVFDANGAFTGYRGIGRDITARKRNEQRLVQLGRMYAALGAANEAVLRARSADEALERACEIAVEAGGFLLGVVYKLDAATQALRRAAASGPAALADEPDPPSLDGSASTLVSRACRNGVPAISNDRSPDATMYEVGSAAVFPLRVDGELAGTFGLQHAERNAFSPELVALLERLAANICFALENFKREARRLEAERALRESEQRFRALTELSSDWYWQQDAELRFVSTSGASDARGGITPEAHVGLCRWELPRTEILGQTWDEHRRVLEARQPFQDLLLRRHGENGEMRYVSVNGQPFFDAQGAFAGYYGIAKDVTNRIVAELALRESEARFRSLTDLSADFYWETDANHRLVRTTQGGSAQAINAPGSEIGKTRWEIASMDAHLPFRDFEIARIDAEGVERHLSISGEPVFDAAGMFTGYRGVGKEITARKREENLLALEHEVTRCLAEAPSANAGIREVIRAVCTTQGWPCGRYFAVDADAGVLRFAEAWGQRDPRVERFLERSRAMVYQRGRGLSGIVWDTGEALWVRDVSKDPRASGASGTFLDGGAFVFPVSSDGRRLGVLSFSSPNARESDARLLQAARIIGSQVGQFLMRKRAEKKQRRRAEDLQRFRAAMDMSLDAIYLADRGSMRFVDVNKVGCEWLGLTRGELLSLGPHDVLNTPREQLEREYDAVIAEGATGMRSESSYTSKDGRMGWAETHRRALRSEDGWIVVTISRDITERKRAEQRQAAHLRYQERVARFGQAALVKSDAAELVEKAVQAALEALGAEAVAYFEPGRGAGELVVRAVVGIVGAGPGVISGGPDDPMIQAMRAGTRLVAEGAHLPVPWARGMGSAALVPVRSDEKVRGVLCACYKTRDAFGAEELNFIEATASVLATALQRIDSEGRLAYLAQFDPLTGLPNRTLLADRFSQMIMQAKRRNAPLAALFIDLDEFKMVNDTLGHAGGDALLKEVAVRLQSTVRTGDTVARISGDEFAIVLADLARPEDAALIAQKVLDRLAGAVEVHGNEVFITASVGIAAFPADGADAETLLGAADAAMYRAKQSGRNAYQFFTADINQRSRQRAQLGNELRRALERDEFMLVYQPKFHLAERRASGAEALLRWKHPERGIVSPVEFIPVLEETGLIVQVGEWVMRRACEDLKRWQAAGLTVGPISVNLSARQFRQQDLDVRIKELVAGAAVSPALLELEITESHLMQDPDHAIRVMRALADAGLRIAIDDFGTGYSSLAYLTRFPLSSLKIDRSFVKDMASDKADATIVRTIIEMAHTLGFTVVAEGVETEEQAAFLRALRCEHAQGYLFARPMPAQEVARFWGG